MSELKVYSATVHPKMKNACDGDVEVYLKSEADKVIAEKDTKIQRLRRALWLARAYRGRDNSILLPSKFMRNVWDNVERKCRAKAEEYK